jgi:hypothetical protein
VDWLDHTNLMAEPGGLIDCVEDMDAGAPACFYRFKWQEGTEDRCRLGNGCLNAECGSGINGAVGAVAI